MHNYSCPTCGAQLYWDPKKGSLYCQYCDSSYSPDEFEDKTANTEDGKAPSVSAEKLSDNVVVSDNENVVVYECKTCGGEVVAQKTTMATVCPYCGEAVSITTKSVGDFRPDRVIPFAQDKKGIANVFKNYVNKSFLTPAAFKNDNTIDKIQGLFVPYYLHTMTDKAQNFFKGEKITYHRSGNDRVATHKVYRLSIDATGKFDKIPTDAAKDLENELMDALEPYTYKDLASYNPAYMAGFVAEQKDEDIDVLQQRAKIRCENGMNSNARQAFAGYDSLLPTGSKHSFFDIDSEYVMLPVWMLNVKHNGKKYRFAVNGQTGKIVGKLPINWGKFAAICAGTFALAEIAVAVIGFYVL